MKKINCKWCGIGHRPRDDGDHWIVKSVFPPRIDIKECAYHKAGQIRPIAIGANDGDQPATKSTS